ncbi:MAG: OB-fold nucleic acid binding domain-containing protein [Candidatus Parvarchaeota archaeon]|nr:OB-fold nucleic acid binding domain-containing protein [Candidatus Jingweiarchaeum tengchongense]MCW1300110.1 OB-fold nucleic acid binding domain-containing protein [Candidatus Jingweiarchaeum tengchongense]MCW1304464.1 OB-fold nucleic acid binding domain-containing protein [Candidatus Jingweiarchaeum tengchongense]MCW1305631.1 OB-fold nucleic acid binding domain-containing protein [Candidatus Jingweiarchaeum tengchongense]MCW1311011.1 OB-fold nucleic acid binding domain-containing protein [
MFTKIDTAYKLTIKDIVDAEPKEDNRTIRTKFGLNVRKARIIGSVMKIFISEDNKYGFIVLDDGTETIRIKSFDPSKNFSGIKIGDIVDVIGRINVYKNEVYLVEEKIIKVDDPNWEIERKIEIMILKEKLKKLIEKEEEEKGEETKVQIKEEKILDEKEIEMKSKVLNIIRSLDKGEGVDIKEILNEISDKIKCQEILRELLEESEIYEPKPGKFKILEE